MATIMTQGNSDGERRCDATCHNAKHAKCTCICGGRYHGVGSSAKAQEMLTEDWLGENWRERKAEVEAAGGSFVAHLQKAFAQAVRSVGDVKAGSAEATLEAQRKRLQGKLPL